MSRQSRLFIAGTSVHVIQRGNNGMQVFDRSEDYEVFLALLKKAALKGSLASGPIGVGTVSDAGPIAV